MIAWDYATDEEQKRIYYDMISVQRTDGAPWLGEGSKYHCDHEMGDVNFIVTDWNPPVHFVSDEVALGIPIQFTMRILPQGNGSVIQIMCDPPKESDPDELEPIFREAAQEALRRLVAIRETVSDRKR